MGTAFDNTDASAARPKVLLQLKFVQLLSDRFESAPPEADRLGECFI